jgi:hypothetical protein
MEELVKMLVDEGAIDASTDTWTVNPGKLVTTHVPQTLTGVLQARLDGLKPAEKLALQQASVIGIVFWDHGLSAIDARAIDALPALTKRELIVPSQNVSLEDVREYAFKHQILHHVTYDTVLKRVRMEYHAKVATWMAGLTGARAGDFLGATAEHFEKAGDTSNAGEFYTRAAEHAAARYAHESAMGYAGRALALIGDAHVDDPLLRWRVLDTRERTLDFLGRRTEQRSDIDALEHLPTLWKTIAVAVKWLGGAATALRTANFRAMESAARETMALAKRLETGYWSCERSIALRSL